MREGSGKRPASSVPTNELELTFPFEAEDFVVPTRLQPWIKRIFVNRGTPQSRDYAFSRVPEVAGHLAFIASSAAGQRASTAPEASRLVVSGVQRRLYAVPFPMPEVVVFLFRTGTLGSLGIPCEALADQVIDADLLGKAWLKEAAEQLAEAKSTESRVTLASVALEEAIRKAGATTQCVRLAEGLVRACAGKRRSRDLAGATGYSDRQLRRVSLSVVGVPPKDVTKIQRINAVLRGSEGPCRWAESAMQHGFHDQAHLIHEFRAALGDAPERFVQGLVDRRLLRDHLVLRNA